MGLASKNLRVPLDQDEDGVIRVAKTRVTLDTVVGAFNLGASAEGIVDRYDSLSLSDVYAVIAYCLTHKDEVDEYRHLREEHDARIRVENEQRFPRADIRERLLSRRAGQR